MANANLSNAKRAKQDEFYTQYSDIEKEVNAYLEYNPDTFKGKVVLLPCDDPEWSNFTRFFALHFESLGLRRLVSTSYAPAKKQLQEAPLITMFEAESPQFDPTKAQTRGKIFPDFDTLLVSKPLSADIKTFLKNIFSKWVAHGIFFVPLHHVCTQEEAS